MPKETNSFVVLLLISLISSILRLTTPVAAQSLQSLSLNELTGDESVLNPSTLQVQLQLEYESIQLSLRRNPNVDNFALVIIGANGTRLPWSQQRTGDFSVYQDAQRRASMLVFPERSTSGQIVRQYQGTFTHAQEEYILEPSSKRDRRKRGLKDMRIPRHKRATGYVAYKAPPVNVTFGPQLTPNNSNQYYNELLEFADGSVPRSNNTVEVLVVVDYAIYRTWYLLSDKTTDTDRANDAINGIRYYYSQIINGMDLRYSNIKVSDFSINIRLAGFYIATQQSDSLWTEKTGIRQVYNSVVYSDAYKALDALADWAVNIQKDLPIFDQASLFTGNKLIAGFTAAGFPFRISGLANIRVMCAKGSVSVNLESGEYATTVTASHELGHNLGSYHDGDSNSCNLNDQYIMASAPKQLTAANFLNPFQFSACSIDYMRTYLRALSLMSSNCLISTSAVNQTNVNTNINTPPGQFINIDKQCQHIFGVNSYYCGGEVYDKQICYNLWCYDPSPAPHVTGCVTSATQRAASGTTCGNKQWCSNGECVTNSAAPAAPVSCISGDQKGTVDIVGGNSVNCSVKIKQDASRCYDQYWNSTCCASCQQYLQTSSAKGCQYGDQDLSYCSRIAASACYDDQVAKICCLTCQKLQQSYTKGCEYGDRASWCSTLTDGSNCYASNVTCCKFCATKRLGYTDCMYGDKAPWCPTISQMQCTDPSTAQVCCMRCDPTKTTLAPHLDARVTRLPPTRPPVDPSCTDQASWCPQIPSSYCYTAQKLCCRLCYYASRGISDCQYGNRFDWCATLSLSECVYPENQDDCCDRCAGFRKNAAVPLGSKEFRWWAVVPWIFQYAIRL